ncbi:MAG: carbohydrate ABC transporter permease, partial [Chloroflexi bacterium]|nr:carbohydrate ABC transporter permease [Chloroflexota bacterium]
MSAHAPATTASRSSVAVGSRHRPVAPRLLLHGFLLATALVWLLPPAWAIYTSLRPYADTAQHGYVSLPGVLNFDNYVNAWTQADLPHYYANTLIVVVPSLILILLLSSFVAFVVARFSFRFNLALLMLFTAGNLLPQQTIITPLYRLYLALPLPDWLSDSGLFFDSYVGVIAIHVAFQMGFCTFVLSNYMKTIPKELSEAALVDGASVWRTFWGVVAPLTRPALAALATLEFTFIYNDYFWALVLMQTGAKRPITSALSNLQGLFFTDNNLIAAGAILVALPTVVVYLLLQRQFVRGL